MTAKAGHTPSGKLEDNALWREGCDLAEYMYGKLHELPEEEKWDSEAKLRHAASDVMFYLAQAIGNASPGNVEYDWGNVRKCVYGLKTIYRFVCRQKFIALEPAVMVRIDHLINEVDVQIQKAYEQTAARNKQDLEQYRAVIEAAKQARKEKVTL